ncbi:MAG: hypothetical protein AB7H90_01280 [Alphaproteobacteria bacterium]
MPRYIAHRTLDTAHSRRSYREEIADDAALTLARQQIDEALAGMRPEIYPGYHLSASTQGGALLATVEHIDDGPIVTIGVARTPLHSARLWPLLREIAPDIGDPPPVPWCAVKLWPALNAHLDATVWLGDFERTLAWAWAG